MVYINSKNDVNLNLDVELILDSENHKKELTSFLEEQIEIWANRKFIQSELEVLETEESEILTLN